MRVLHLSWEFPPQIIGGLGRHVEALAAAQSSLGDEVAVLTASTGAILAAPEQPRPVATSAHPTQGAVCVIRVVPGPPRLRFQTDNLLAWVAGLEHALVRGGLQLARRWRPEVIHCHDWMVAQAGNTLRAALDVPLVSTIHASEAGRAQGWVSSPLNAAVHSVEWWLANCSDQVIACSGHMRAEVSTLFQLDPAGVMVIPNGIDLTQWSHPGGAAESVRWQYAQPGAPLVVYTGRVEWEKGVQTLVAALPTIRGQQPDVRLVVTGRGTHLPALQAQAERLGLNGSVTFTGWLPEDQMHALVAAADLAVVPSLYEPFGLVALEAAALGTPVLVAATGGLAEFAQDGRNAGVFTPGDPGALAEAALQALRDPGLRAAWVAAAGQKLIDDHQWARIAELTAAAYSAGAATHAADPHRVDRVPIPDFHAPMGNLLTGEPPA